MGLTITSEAFDNGKRYQPFTHAREEITPEISTKRPPSTFKVIV